MYDESTHGLNMCWISKSTMEKRGIGEMRKDIRELASGISNLERENSGVTARIQLGHIAHSVKDGRRELIIQLYYTVVVDVVESGQRGIGKTANKGHKLGLSILHIRHNELDHRVGVLVRESGQSRGDRGIVVVCDGQCGICCRAACTSIIQVPSEHIRAIVVQVGDIVDEGHANSVWESESAIRSNQSEVGAAHVKLALGWQSLDGNSQRITISIGTVEGDVGANVLACGYRDH